MDLIKYVYWGILISGKRADSEKLYGFGSDVKGMVQPFSFPNPKLLRRTVIQIQIHFTQ